MSGPESDPRPRSRSTSPPSSSRPARPTARRCATSWSSSTGTPPRCASSSTTTAGVVGVVTDGDLRRALLARRDPRGRRAPATRAPTRTSCARARAARHVLDLMRALRISAVPEVDADGPHRAACTPCPTSSAPRPCPTSRSSWPAAGAPGWARLTQDTPEAADDGRRAARSSTGSSSASSATASARSTSASTTSPTRSRSTSATARGSAAGSPTCARSPTTRSAPPARCGCSATRGPTSPTPSLVMNGDLMVEFDARAAARAPRRARAPP